MSIYDVMRSIWRNHPQGVSTFSECECGRKARRGGEPCLECLSEKLQAGGVSELEYDHLCNLIRDCRLVEKQVVARVIRCVGESAEL